jgi:CspA family cold shock protein
MAANEMGKITETEGEVKWFDPRKGFGFIVGPDGQDIFVHFTVIQGDGFRVLRDGATVEYDAEHSDKGWRATRVIRPVETEVGETSTGYARTPRR